MHGKQYSDEPDEKKRADPWRGQRRPAPCSRRELELRALALQGCSLERLAQALGQQLPADPRTAKGYIGQLVELALGADAKAGTLPDFPHLGVELKTVPLDARGVPVESTFCCSIAMAGADRAEWENSRLRQRLGCVLWVPVEGIGLRPWPQRCFGRARLWVPDALQTQILRGDWEHLMGEIGAGRGPQLTAHAGRVLQVRPKAAHAGVRTLGAGPDGPEAVLPLAFYLRAHFTAAVLAE